MEKTWSKYYEIQLVWLSLFFLTLELLLFKLFSITEQDTTSVIAYSDCDILYSVQHSDTAVGIMK